MPRTSHFRFFQLSNEAAPLIEVGISNYYSTVTVRSLAIAAGPLWWKDPTVLLTGVIAVATVGFVVCTVALWLSTRRAANAATIAAEAAKKSAEATIEAAAAARKSADLLSAQHRPYVGVLAVELVGGSNAENGSIWLIAWTVKNFGTLPALNVGATLEFKLDRKTFRSESGPCSAEIFPQSSSERTLTDLKLDDADRIAVRNGDKALAVAVQINYGTTDGQQFAYTAEVRYKRGFGTFYTYESWTRAV